MGEITMSWSRYLLLFACLFGGGSACAQDLVSCPQKQNQSLERAEVFDGPIERRGILMPDLATSEWQLELEQANAKAAKEHLHLVCHYRGVAEPVVLEIPYQATLCAERGTEADTSAGCRAANPASDNKAKDGHGHQS
ncbi:STY0301 family protein [Massilia solisilvae]